MLQFISQHIDNPQGCYGDGEGRSASWDRLGLKQLKLKDLPQFLKELGGGEVNVTWDHFQISWRAFGKEA